MGKNHDSINLHDLQSKKNHLEKQQKPNWKCCIWSLISFAVVIISITIVSLVFIYIRWEAHRKEEKSTSDYLLQLVKQVNSAPEARWKAKFNPFGIKNTDYNYKSLKNVTAVKEYMAYLKSFFKSEAMEQHLKELEEFADADLPRNFDAREKWPHCPSLHHVPNQGGCGSCYAVASMGVASDRTCIHTNGSYKSELSAQDVLGCCQVCGTCYGGDPIKALTYWALEGVVSGGSDGCRPYIIGGPACGTPCLPDEYPKAEAVRRCERKCQPSYYKNSYEKDKQFASIAYTLYPRKMTLDQSGKEKALVPSVIGHFNETSLTKNKRPLSLEETRSIIKKELLMYGPTTMALPLTEEFLHYESGVYHPLPEKDFEKRIIYWHVVRLMGWGHDDQDRLHWIAINSFGAEWGENGLFRVDPSLVEKFGLEFEAGLL